MRAFRSALWGNRDFVRLWAATTVSIFGTLVTRTALPFTAILVLGAGPLEIASLRSLELVAGLAVGLAAGAWVDRLRRRPILVAADLGRAALLVSIPAAALLGALGMPQLYAVAFLAAILTTLFEVANRSFLPAVVGRDDLLAANSALTASSSAAEFTAFGAGGFLIQLLTAPITILVDSVSFVVSALCLRGIRAPEPPPPAPADRAPVRREIRDGLALLFGHPTLRPIALAAASVEALFGIFGATYLLYANQVLGFSPAAIGVIAAIGGISSFAGAVAAGPLTRRFGLGPVLVGSMIAVSVGSAFIPLAPHGVVLGALCLVAQQLVADSAVTVFDIGDVTVRQSLVDDRRLGRVNGSVRVLGLAAQLAGTLAGGVLAEAVGIRGALAAGACGGLLGAAFIYLSPVRRLRDVPRREGAPGAPVIAGEDVPLGE